jgi:Leucine-rich repeat (LRR) protein
MSSLDRQQKQAERRIAIQRQMDLMEQAALGRNIPDILDGNGESTTDNKESARRFLDDSSGDSSPNGSSNGTPPGGGPSKVNGEGGGGFLGLLQKSFYHRKNDQEFDTMRQTNIAPRSGGFSGGGSSMNTMNTMNSVQADPKRRKRCLFILASVCLTAILVPTVGGKWSEHRTKKHREKENVTIIPQDMAARRLAIQDTIIKMGLSDPDQLLRPDTAPYKALDWVAIHDKAQLPVHDSFLPHRFALATLYFSTHGDLMFAPVPDDGTADIPELSNGEGDVRDEADEKDEEEAIIAADDFSLEPDWLKEDNWLSAKGICTWYGISCHHRTGTPADQIHYNDNWGISILNLTENNVRGTIPPELLLVLSDEIRAIDLSGNGIWGDLPLELGELDTIEGLYLDENFIGGTMPGVELAKMTKLQNLYLAKNILTGPMPSQLSELANLKGLTLHDNQLTGTLPTEIGSMPQLELMYLDLNLMTGTIPTEYGSFPAIHDLRLRNNYFGGTIPKEFGNAVTMETLYLDNNELVGTLPTELSKLKYLDELHVYKNGLTGTLPTEYGLLKKLHHIYMDSNGFIGTIPKEWGNIKDLQQLYLYKNKLTGFLPTELGLMKDLYNFRIQSNRISGSIPTEIGNNFKLQSLYLHENSLTGTVPTELSELSRLVKFNIHGNDITGSVPEEVCDLRKKKLELFVSDCDERVRQVQCECCTSCHAD